MESQGETIAEDNVGVKMDIEISEKTSGNLSSIHPKDSLVAQEIKNPKEDSYLLDTQEEKNPKEDTYLLNVNEENVQVNNNSEETRVIQNESESDVDECDIITSNSLLKDLENNNVYLLSSSPTNGEPFSTIPPPKYVLSVHDTIIDALSNGLAFQTPRDLENQEFKSSRQFIEPSSILAYEQSDSLLYSTFHPPDLTTILKTTELYEKIGIFVDWRSVKTQYVKTKKTAKKTKGFKSKGANNNHASSNTKRKSTSTNGRGGRKKRKLTENDETSADALVDDRSMGYDEIDIISTSTTSIDKQEADKNDQSVALLLSSLASNIKSPPISTKSSSPTPTPKKKPGKRTSSKKDKDYKYDIDYSQSSSRSSRSSRSKQSRRSDEITDFEFFEGWTGEVVMVKQSHWPWWPALVMRQDFVKMFGNWGQKPPITKSGFRIPVFHLFDVNGIGQAWITDKQRVRLFKHMNTPQYTEDPERENNHLIDSKSALENFRKAIIAAKLHLQQSEEGIVEHKPELPDDLPQDVPSDFELSIIKKAVR